MKLLAAILASLALVAAAGCGDDDEKKSGEPAATTSQPAKPGQPAKPAPAPSSAEDEDAVKEVVIDWTFEGKCELMTDKFLEAQLLGLGEDRQERCDLFEKQHQKPQYSEDDVKIEDVKITGTKASLIVTSELAPDIKSRYDLVKTGDQWQIDAAELE
ncbi:MAG TPA: hypothetical protein VF712_20195 [Thermoleophilaceae bacterium]|jgi:hypothetical protein